MTTKRNTTRTTTTKTAGKVAVSYRVPARVVAVLELERARRIAAGARRLDVDRSDLVGEAVLKAFDNEHAEARARR